VEIAEYYREVGQVGEHAAAVEPVARPVDRRAVEARGDLSAEQESEPGGGHDDVGRQPLARGEPHALRVEPGDRAGDDPGAPSVDGLDQVAIGDEAEPLLPRAIGRFEQRRIVTGAEFALEAP